MPDLTGGTKLLPRSVVEISDPDLVQFLISVTRNDQNSGIALMTVLVYHSALVLDQEVKYFWTNPLSYTSLVYFANRCVGMLSIISNILYNTFTEDTVNCVFLYWMNNLANLATVVLIDHILVIRVLALYEQNRKISFFLKVLLGLEAGVGLGLYIYDIHNADPAMAILAEGGTICGTINGSLRSIIIVSWTLQAAYGLLLLVFALYKAAEYWRMSSGFKGFHLVRVLVQDQLLYYALVIICCLGQVVTLSILDINPVASFILTAIFSPTLFCVLGGQLLVNLKEAGERGLNGGTNYTPQSVSDIDFAQRDDAPALSADIEMGE